MDTKTIIYLVAAALVFRVIVRTIIKYQREGRTSDSAKDEKDNDLDLDKDEAVDQSNERVGHIESSSEEE